MRRPGALATAEQGVPVGRHRDWIPVTTLSVPTVWLATADGIVSLDLVAVELAINGRRQGWTLTSHEAAYAADLLFRRGVQYSVITRLVGVSGATLRKWFPTDDTPLHEAVARIRPRTPIEKVHAASMAAVEARAVPRCGTYPAAKRHQRRKEPLDAACLEARRLADRHYREHGTYVGTPDAPLDFAA
jgi:hypothetical protein